MYIEVSLPLTTPSGKIRIKERTNNDENGIPFATRQKKINENCYIEWQIGYDILKSDEKKVVLSSLQDMIFKAYNGDEKVLYELSEYIYYLYKWVFFLK